MMGRVCVLLALLMTSAVVAADIQVANAWLRELIPGQNNTVAYLQLHNSGLQGRQLTAVESNFALRAEMHTQIMTDGMMRMRKLDKLDIGALETVAFAAGGHHIMLYGMDTLLNAKDRNLVLIFINGERLSVTLKLRPLADSPLKPHTHYH
tara:strand:+ start:674 stop:1126 length:453 start_codon:yes stop_codon:yes gene_type:complete